MNKYFFDTDARIRFYCEAESEDDAVNNFIEAINDAEMKIDIESYRPTEERIDDNDND